MFTGTVPSQLAMLREMTAFQAYDNLFEGTIPTEMGLLSSLQMFDLSGNCTSVLSLPAIYIAHVHASAYMVV